MTISIAIYIAQELLDMRLLTAVVAFVTLAPKPLLLALLYNAYGASGIALMLLFGVVDAAIARKLPIAMTNTVAAWIPAVISSGVLSVVLANIVVTWLAEAPQAQTLYAAAQASPGVVELAQFAAWFYSARLVADFFFSPGALDGPLIIHHFVSLYAFLGCRLVPEGLDAEQHAGVVATLLVLEPSTFAVYLYRTLTTRGSVVNPLTSLGVALGAVLAGVYLAVRLFIFHFEAFRGLVLDEEAFNDVFSPDAHGALSATCMGLAVALNVGWSVRVMRAFVRIAHEYAAKKERGTVWTSRRKEVFGTPPPATVLTGATRRPLTEEELAGTNLHAASDTREEHDAPREGASWPASGGADGAQPVACGRISRRHLRAAALPEAIAVQQ